MQWIGWLIARLDRAWNQGTFRRARGAMAVAVILAAAIAPAWLLQHLAWRLLPGGAAATLLALLMTTLLAQRSLYDHVRAVGEALRADGLVGGRAAVSRIVGRNPERLDEAGIVRAAIESLAENFSDGVVAPALWAALFGLPGIALYKAANTADSMIGHRTARHAAFGWAAARLDDVVNLPASRLAAFWLVLAALLRPDATARDAWRATWRDARRHRSPNAGWPEAAMAGALGLRLAGPRVYGDTVVRDAWMGDGPADAARDDLARGLALYRVACGLQITAFLALVAGT